jgi:cellulose synthase/poly-beta-1,6-N-acetylglucosamine synthase-like glycosyltransferase
VSLLQEKRLFASRLSRFAVFVAFCHLMCLLFLGTCFVSIVVAVYVLALRFCSVFSCCSLFVCFFILLLVRSFRFSSLIKGNFAVVRKVWRRGGGQLHLPAFPARTWLNLLLYDTVAAD